MCAVHAGLDARAAAIVMRSVKNVSRNGRTVMVTIHQPSIEIFEGFDALFLLQRGGRVGHPFPHPFLTIPDCFPHVLTRCHLYSTCSTL